MARDHSWRRLARPFSPRAAWIGLAVLLTLAATLLAAGCAAPAQAPASPTLAALTVAPAPSPTAEAKAAALAASPTPAPSPTRAPSPTLGPSPTPAAPTPTAAPTARPTSTPAASADYPRVDGSTSTQPLEILVACKRLGVPCQWQESLTSTRTERTLQPGPSSVKMPPLQHTNTSQAYMNLIAGKTDLILEARLPSEDEKAAAEKAGVKLDIRPVALDAFVILLNRANSIESLSIQQVRDVYTGKMTSWTKLGGKVASDNPDQNADRISAYTRPRNSGSQELMESLVMKGAKSIIAPDLMQQGMEGMMNAINGDESGIGYIVYYYASTMLAYDGIKLIGVEGIKPSAETIANRTYPLVAEVYVVTRADIPANSQTAITRDWLLTPEGQAVVAESGYVPLKAGSGIPQAQSASR